MKKFVYIPEGYYYNIRIFPDGTRQAAYRLPTHQEAVMPNFRSLESLRRRICTIIDIGTADDLISRAYDIFYTLVILVNLVVTIAYTFDEAEAACGPLLLRIEAATVAFFAVDCALRIWTAKYHHPNLKEWKAVCRYIFSLKAFKFSSLFFI